MSQHPSIVSRITHRRPLAESAAGQTAPWWLRLDADFWRQRERFAMSWRERAQVGATAGIDLVTRTFGALAVGATALPLSLTPKKIASFDSDGDFYARLADAQDLSVFVQPPRVTITAREAHGPHFQPTAGVCEDLAFESPFEPVYPASRAAYLAHGKNRIAHARYWRHHGEARPTVVAIHGFSADLYALNEWFFGLPWLYDQGCDVLLLTLPHHGRRRDLLSPFSGHGFFAGGIAGINEALLQAVCDFRVCNAWVRSRGAPAVGVTGVSIGGYISALLAAVEPTLAFALPNVPLVSIADVALEWEPIGAVLRLLMAASGVDVAALRRMLAVHSPLTYPPRLSTSQLFIVGGVGDRLAPPKHSRVLWEHWQGCRMHWFPGSHLLHLDKGAYLREIAKFLRGIGFLPG